jgi:hypothetical protein
MNCSAWGFGQITLPAIPDIEEFFDALILSILPFTRILRAVMALILMSQISVK